MAYGLAELARASGVSERTIRYYQGEQLLPRHAKRGRDAVYGPEHLERLTLIGELRDQGLNLQTIRELVRDDRPSDAVRSWIDIHATLRTPWSQDRPRSMTDRELNDTIAAAAAAKPGVVGDLADAGYIRRDRSSRDTWIVPSPALLDSALRLQQAGIDIDVSGRMRDLLRRRLAKAIDDIVALLVERTGSGFAAGATPEELARALSALRPVAGDVVGVLLAHEVDRALGELSESPPGTTRSRRR